MTLTIDPVTSLETCVPESAENATPPLSGRIARGGPPQKNGQCAACSQRELCMPHALSCHDGERPESLLLTARTVRRGETLFRHGDVFDYLYVVRFGALKTSITGPSGRDQVMGLHLAGDAVGLDAFEDGTHLCQAIALEDSRVCMVSLEQVERACRDSARSQHRLLQLVGAEIRRKSAQILALGSQRADERVAALLLDVSARIHRLGFSAIDFNVRLTREDIGSLLGMTVETVCRALTRFQKNGFIHTDGKRVQIHDFKGLANV